MNKAKKLIIGGMLAAGIAGGGLAVAGSFDAHGAKPAAQAGPAAKGHSVDLDTSSSTAPDASDKPDCNAVHARIRQGAAVTGSEVFSCENTESNALFESGNPQGETETCKLVNQQTADWKTQNNISQQIQDLCKAEESSAQQARQPQPSDSQSPGTNN